MNFALIAATAIAAVSLLPTVRELSNPVPLPTQEQDLSTDRLAELVAQQLSQQDCVALSTLIEKAAETVQVTAALDAIGLDIYAARETIADLDAPPSGYVAALSEQVELAAARPLKVVLQDNPQFEDRYRYSDMADSAAVELVRYCALQEPLGRALALQQQADAALQRVASLADEPAWYPEGFTRSLDNLAWGWTSDQGQAPCQNCVYWKVTLVTRDGCLGGALVEVEVFDGDASLVKLRETWQRLAEGASVTAEFPYQQLNPELTAKVTMAECFAHEQP